ncbi:hypothetical protein KJA15_02950 [Patescibacteria group bacterium]|nr:hypothetical protein [Patescibacteria group bacterium]
MTANNLQTIFNGLIILGIILSAIGTIGQIYINKKIEKEFQQELKKVQPRHLSISQKNQLTVTLSKKKGKVGLVSRLLDGESLDFAEEIASVFKDAGWNVLPTNQTSLNDYTGFLKIFVTGKNMDSVVNLISQTFNEVGIDLRSGEVKPSSIGGSLQADTVYIVVGRKD